MSKQSQHGNQNLGCRFHVAQAAQSGKTAGKERTLTAPTTRSVYLFIWRRWSHLGLPQLRRPNGRASGYGRGDRCFVALVASPDTTRSNVLPRPTREPCRHHRVHNRPRKRLWGADVLHVRAITYSYPAAYRWPNGTQQRQCLSWSDEDFCL